jgi:hypothetical protein
MICLVKMFGRVFVRRAVAATDVTAGFAKPQMHTALACF